MDSTMKDTKNDLSMFGVSVPRPQLDKFYPQYISKLPVTLDGFFEIIIYAASWRLFYDSIVSTPMMDWNSFIAELLNSFYVEVKQSIFKRTAKQTQRLTEQILSSTNANLRLNVDKEALSDNILVFWVGMYFLYDRLNCGDNVQYSTYSKTITAVKKRADRQAAKISKEICKQIDRLEVLLSESYWRRRIKNIEYATVYYLETLRLGYREFRITEDLQEFKDLVKFEEEQVHFVQMNVGDQELQQYISTDQRQLIEHAPYYFMHWLIKILGLRKKTAARIVVELYTIFKIKEVMEDFDGTEKLAEELLTPMLKHNRITNTLRQYQRMESKIPDGLRLGETNLISSG